MKEKLNSLSQKVILILIALGIWAIVFQNAGILHKEEHVYVTGGDIDADVSGYIDAAVDGRVDVNIEAINGHRDVFFNNLRRGEKDKYYRIPVSTE